MKLTTSLQIDADNFEVVQELSRTKEFSKVVNILLREYREKLGIKTKNKDNIILELKEQIEKKQLQYEALKKSISEA